eukprot:EG_transcript_7189
MAPAVCHWGSGVLLVVAVLLLLQLPSPPPPSPPLFLAVSRLAARHTHLTNHGAVPQAARKWPPAQTPPLTMDDGVAVPVSRRPWNLLPGAGPQQPPPLACWAVWAGGTLLAALAAFGLQQRTPRLQRWVGGGGRPWRCCAASYLDEHFGPNRWEEPEEMEMLKFDWLTMTVTNLYNRMLDSGDVEGTRLTEAMNLEEAMKLITLNFRPDLVPATAPLRHFVVPDRPMPSPRMRAFAVVTPVAGPMPFDDTHTMTAAAFPGIHSPDLGGYDSIVQSDMVKRFVCKIMGLPRVSLATHNKDTLLLTDEDSTVPVPLAPRRWLSADRQAWSETVHLITSVLCPTAFLIEGSEGRERLHVILPDCLQGDELVLEMFLQERTRAIALRPGMLRAFYRLLRQSLPKKRVGDVDVEMLAWAMQELPYHWVNEASVFVLKRGFRDAARRLARMQLEVSWQTRAELQADGVPTGPVATWSTASHLPTAAEVRGQHLMHFVVLDTPRAMGRYADTDTLGDRLVDIVRLAQGCKSFSLVGVTLNEEGDAAAAEAFLAACLGRAQEAVRWEALSEEERRALQEERERVPYVPAAVVEAETDMGDFVDV